MTVEIKEHQASNTQFYEYHQAAKPSLPSIPIKVFEKSQYDSGKTRIISLDNSHELGVSYPATSPTSSIHIVRINQAETLVKNACASSHFFYVYSGAGSTRNDDSLIEWQQGDVFVLPACQTLSHSAKNDAILYWVNDAPLLSYLNVVPADKNFQQTHFPRASILKALNAVKHQTNPHEKNRNGVILSIANCQATKTITPVHWVLFNSIQGQQFQKPHRHNSVAYDFVLACPSQGVYTLMSDKVDSQGNLINPRRINWAPGSIFITPPGLWHSHHNESSEEAIIMPVQDAGIQTYMRTLDIQFST